MVLTILGFPHGSTQIPWCTSKWGRGHASCVKLFRVVPPYNGKRQKKAAMEAVQLNSDQKEWGEPARISGHHGHGT